MKDNLTTVHPFIFYLLITSKNNRIYIEEQMTAKWTITPKQKIQLSTIKKTIQLNKEYLTFKHMQ